MQGFYYYSTTFFFLSLNMSFLEIDLTPIIQL